MSQGNVFPKLEELVNAKAMNIHIPTHFQRRRLLQAFAAGAAYWTIPGAFAEALTQTPAQTEGPFYPDKLPLDTDNDLIIINDTTDPSLGQVTWLSGRVLDKKGDPVRNALVEIWQADNNGAYLHSKSGNAEKRDSHFQGYGRFLTGVKGEYLFRTIKPVAYPGRTPHIHYKVTVPSKQGLTTQCYIKGEPQNDKDMVLRGLKDPAAKAALMADFTPLANSKANELAATFDLVLGFTPEQS